MAGAIRISGLIRIADSVRRELAGSMTAERRDRLRKQVQGNIDTVNQILRNGGGRVESLPAPSQRAYRFLVGIDWNKVSATELLQGESSNRPPVIRSMISWPRLTSFIDGSLDRLADVSDDDLRSECNIISIMSRQIELTIQRKNVTPDRMSPATRAQRGWLAFFSQAENLKAYVDARRVANRIIDAAAAGSRHFPPPMVIHFRPVSGIYKLRATRSRPILWLPTPMIAFDEPRFQTLASLIFDRRSGARQRVMELLTGEDYQEVRAELESLGGIAEQSRGAVHDLGASFDRVNAGYFGGKMARPRLTWNRTFTGRKFGHYDFVLDTVMVSRTLDSPNVPEFVVDFLVFHELLHKFHGLHWVNGRGYAHTSEFYESEKKFAKFHEAERILDKLAREVR